jgi:hypothetical protein
MGGTQAGGVVEAVRRNAVTPTNTGSRRNLVGADQAGSIGRAGYPNGYSRACNNR